MKHRYHVEIDFYAPKFLSADECIALIDTTSTSLTENPALCTQLLGWHSLYTPQPDQGGEDDDGAA